jgi:preprotein translocase subunit YajC
MLKIIAILLLPFSAIAQDAAAAAPKGDLLTGFVLPLLFIFVVFYFIVIRPQTKKFKEHQAIIDSLKKGDKIITSGGIVGVISKVTEGAKIIEVEIAKDVKIGVVRATITEVFDQNKFSENKKETK